METPPSSKFQPLVILVFLFMTIVLILYSAPVRELTNSFNLTLENESLIVHENIKGTNIFRLPLQARIFVQCAKEW